MRKSLIALCVAAALTAPMIARADANLLMAQPALFFQFEVDQEQPVTLTAEALAAVDNRLPGQQMEASVILANKSTRYGNDGTPGDYNSIDSLASAPFETGWRS